MIGKRSFQTWRCNLSDRILRVEQAIKKEAAQILQQEIKDPRIGFITVTRVKVTPDLQYAKIYVSLLEGHGNPSETLAGLRSAQGYVRRLLGERIRLRVTPEVSFEVDPSVEENIRISKLLGSLKKEGEP